MRAAALIVAAGIIAVAFQAPELTPFSWFGLATFAALLRGGYYKLLPAYLAGITFQLVGMMWIVQAYGSLELTEQRYLNWCLQALFFGAVFPLVVTLAWWLRRWPIWIVLPIVWTVGDVVRLEGGRLIASPYPWLILGYSQTGFLPACQVADLFGVWAVGFLVAMFAGTIAEIIQQRPPLVPIVLIVAALGYGLIRSTPQLLAGPRIALMPAQLESAPEADLALWAETTFDNAGPARKGVNVFGCWRGDTNARFNSVGIQTDRIVWYDKCNLVPWAESGTTTGSATGIFQIGINRVGVAICYDVCFGRFMRSLAAVTTYWCPRASRPTRRNSLRPRCWQFLVCAPSSCDDRSFAMSTVVFRE